MVLPYSDGVPRVPPYSRTSDRLYPYGTITLSGRPFQNRSGFLSEATGLVPFRSPLLRESRLISFPPGTEMFQFPGFASHPYGFRMRYRIKRWVSPFGNPRIKACSQLPAAYRSVPRPSSPPRAKASTRCPYFALEIRHIAMTEKAGPANNRSQTAYQPCAVRSTHAVLPACSSVFTIHLVKEPIACKADAGAEPSPPLGPPP